MNWNIRNTILVVCLLFGSISTVAQESNPPGQLVDLGGYKLHLNIKGDGPATIIIEGGAGSWSLQWLEVQESLSKKFKVVTYDRAGYGWSDASPYSRTASSINEELHLALEKAKVASPYILLGHSYGGLLMKAYANKYPADVKAIILAEAASENQFDQLPPMVNGILQAGMQRFRQTGTMARMGQLSPSHIPIDSTLNPIYWNAYQVSASRHSFYDAMYNEMDLLESTYLQSKIVKPINKPVLVITAGNSFWAFSSIPDMPVAESNKVWEQLQKDLLKTSTQSKQVTVKDATHDLLLTASDKLVETVTQFVLGVK